jgi:hypothetical protein
MHKVLHILRSEPNETVQQLIEAMSGDDGVTVAVLYRDDIARVPVNWHRLVDDIFASEKVICW